MMFFSIGIYFILSYIAYAGKITGGKFPYLLFLTIQIIAGTWQIITITARN